MILKQFDHFLELVYGDHKTSQVMDVISEILKKKIPYS